MADPRWAGTRTRTGLHRAVYRPDPGELDIDIVLHETGVAVDWVVRAGAGDRLGVLGPPWSVPVPEERDWYLLAADATGLPA